MIDALMWTVIVLLLIAVTAWAAAVCIAMARIERIRRRYKSFDLTNAGAYFLLTVRVGVSPARARLKVAVWDCERETPDEYPNTDRLTAPADRERASSGIRTWPRRPRP